ncbi:serine hydrolase domain-containing protein [Prosthecobacter sp.]|uniref:serine hydrolase domain-containing protein n=1 Tax=Prosthecobacter sp. TaxID=1965333 RepID=UPI003784FE32
MDTLIEALMSKANVAGLSLAILHDGKIVKAKGYGVADKNSRMPVTTETLFQAASISKSLAALGALRLVEQKVLSLDADVNTVLKEWKVPENEHTQEKKVTLRGILSHSAGLSVHGFDGYEAGAPVPNLRQVLEGAKPANSAAVRVESVPGTQWKYSGGGYCVLQQMMQDTTAKPFASFMREAVLEPLGMKSSTWEQPLTESRAAQAATGHYGDGTPVKGRWHVYPETAAAGLWTTASDLARFVTGVRRAYAGESTSVITQAMARQMLTVQMNPYGLGLVLDGTGDSLVFSQSGRNEGYDAFVLGYAHKAQGVAILINSNDDSGMLGELLREIVVTCGW